MTDSDMLQPQVKLCAGEKHTVIALEAWLLSTQAEESITLNFVANGIHSSVTLAASWQGLLLIDRAEVSVQSDCLFWPVRVEWLVKLLAFIDDAKEVNQPANRFCWAILPQASFSICQQRRHYEFWFLQQALNPLPEFAQALTLLRGTESYWLVRFLLAQSVYGDTLKDLGDRYGVSNSHFRRLCRQALGGGAKSELRDWRMARSLLDVVERQGTLTEVALKHGYSSSSHFSNEIRQLFGVSPRGLTNIIIQQASK
ncbi:MAG: helix-turn-helix domain-containing protein [Plesiomonas sp.]|uniref:helix-turn-helix domain-containing protein n=1 Tax=Plesiomonas sp. TaxID=2486279 RepID=UPI003F2E3D4A